MGESGVVHCATTVVNLNTDASSAAECGWERCQAVIRVHFLGIGDVRHSLHIVTRTYELVCRGVIRNGAWEC